MKILFGLLLLNISVAGFRVLEEDDGASPEGEEKTQDQPEEEGEKTEEN